MGVLYMLLPLAVSLQNLSVIWKFVLAILLYMLQEEESVKGIADG